MQRSWRLPIVSPSVVTTTTPSKNFTTFKFWSLLSHSYRVSHWSSSVLSCYSMCFKCCCMFSTVIALIRTSLSVFHDCNIFVIIKWHILVAIAHTSLVVLGKCMKSGILMYTYHCSRLYEFSRWFGMCRIWFYVQTHYVHTSPYIPDLDKF